MKYTSGENNSMKNKINYSLFLKILILICLTSSRTFSANGVNIFGGINSANIKFVLNKPEDIDIDRNLGFYLGIEKRKSLFTLGLSFMQNGAVLYNGENYYSVKRSDTYNYVNLYNLISIPLVKEINLCSGFQFGKCIGGLSIIKSDGEKESYKLKSKEFNLYFGLILGLEILSVENCGIRLTYHHGVPNIFKELAPEYNYKSRGVGAIFFYEL